MALLDLLPLALVDSVSVATLAIPIWFLLAPGKPRHGLIWVYLLTVAALYRALGVGLVLVLPSVRAALATVVTSDAGLIGAAMALRARMVKPLEAAESWLRRNAQENTAWLIAVLGFIIFAGTQQYEDLMTALS